RRTAWSMARCIRVPAARLDSTEHSSIFGWQPNSDRPGTTLRAAWRAGFSALTPGVIAAALPILPAHAQTAPTGLRNDVVFTEYSPLSDISELVRRLYSPLTGLRLEQNAERAGHTLRGQPLDPHEERYSIYLPELPQPSSGTYALLVFVPPWPR